MTIEDLTLVICCNRADYFFARLCIASIRYYYPDIAVELVKDPGNGSFCTSEVEKHFGVSIIDFNVEKIGWGAAKLLYLYKFTSKKKVVFLDADIVFIGPFLQR